MKFKHRLLPQLVRTFVVLTVTTLLAINAQAGKKPKSRPITVSGYQMYENVTLPNPSDPTIIDVRTEGQGGVAHLGKMRSWSDDQQGNVTTGELTATYTFEDKEGDLLRFSALGSSVLQPDFRITFEGTLTVIDGTGKFAAASGSLQFEGWARTTDLQTGVGIGFSKFNGIIEGTTIREDAAFCSVDKGNGTIINGVDFVYEGLGEASHIGRFADHAESIPGPFHAAFVGIIDGSFVISSAYNSTWTMRNGDQIKYSAVEFIHFALQTLPDGSPAPDFTQPSFPEIYYTVEEGTGRFANAQGVIMGHGTFIPTGPDTVAAELIGSGFISR